MTRAPDFKTHLVRLTDGRAELATPAPLRGRVTEQQLEDYVIANPQLAGEDLLILGRQLKEFKEDDKRLDLLAVDRDGEIVLIELKVDEDFGVTDLQALAYAAAYANKTGEHFARTLQTSLARRNQHASLEHAKQLLVEFLGREDFSDWEPSQHVRIKLIAPGFPRRVLATVKWLGDLYGLRIEAILVRLFVTNGGESQLTFERVLPLAGEDEFDLTVREREKRKRDENLARRPDVINFLLAKGLLNDGDRLWLARWVLPDEVRDRWSPEHVLFQVEVDASERSPKFIWRPTEDAESQRLSPSRVPYHILRELVPDGEFRQYRSVHDKFLLSPGGKTVGQLAEENGWADDGSERELSGEEEIIAS